MDVPELPKNKGEDSHSPDFMPAVAQAVKDAAKKIPVADTSSPELGINGYPLPQLGLPDVEKFVHDQLRRKANDGPAGADLGIFPPDVPDHKKVDPLVAKYGQSLDYRGQAALGALIEKAAVGDLKGVALGLQSSPNARAAFAKFMQDELGANNVKFADDPANGYTLTIADGPGKNLVFGGNGGLDPVYTEVNGRKPAVATDITADERADFTTLVAGLSNKYTKPSLAKNL
jgi:hypothetical protein